MSLIFAQNNQFLRVKKMAKKVTTTIINELLYSTHVVSIGKGDNKKRIGTINSPKPTALTLQTYIDANVLTLDDVCKGYNVSRAIELQAEARRIVKSDKISPTVYNQLYNELITTDVLKDAIEDKMDTKSYIDEFIISVWEERKNNIDDTETNE